MADLTTLASVKSYLAITTTGQDLLIPSLIANESRLIEEWTGRVFPYVARSKRLNGTGTDRIVLPDSPIINVSSVTVNEKAYSLSDGSSAGFFFEAGESMVYLIGGERFLKGFKNVAVDWTAGYETTQTAFIPAGNTPTLTPSNGGLAVTNVSVTIAATGVAMAEVGSSPSTGQYSFSAGTYTFATADSGVQVTMDYYYVPGPVEQACNMLVGTLLKTRDNLGIQSKSMAGETISYMTKAIPDDVKAKLQLYRRVAPA
jgi:hypothetical protein